MQTLAGKIVLKKGNQPSSTSPWRSPEGWFETHLEFWYWPKNAKGKHQNSSWIPKRNLRFGRLLRASPWMPCKNFFLWQKIENTAIFGIYYHSLGKIDLKLQNLLKSPVQMTLENFAIWNTFSPESGSIFQKEPRFGKNTQIFKKNKVEKIFSVNW